MDKWTNNGVRIEKLDAAIDILGSVIEYLPNEITRHGKKELKKLIAKLKDKKKGIDND